MLDPELVEAYLFEYQRAYEERRNGMVKEKAKIDQTLARVSGRIGRITDLIADGIGDYGEAKGRLVAALQERETIERQLEDAEVAPAIAQHLGIAAAYRRNVEKLAVLLDIPSLQGGEARQALRNLVEVITAEPKADGRGLDLIVHGRLAQSTLPIGAAFVWLSGPAHRRRMDSASDDGFRDGPSIRWTPLLSSRERERCFDDEDEAGVCC